MIRSLVAFDQDSTLVAVVELSLKSRLVGVVRFQEPFCTTVAAKLSSADSCSPHPIRRCAPLYRSSIREALLIIG
jgi:hypothetical protein